MENQGGQREENPGGRRGRRHQGGNRGRRRPARPYDFPDEDSVDAVSRKNDFFVKFSLHQVP